MPEVIATRRSTAAIVQKATEGALEKPTSGSQFITIQPDYSIAPNFGTTENVELKDDIMSGKTIIVSEEPSATYSHYFKGSGTAGTPPEYGPMIQSSFGGYRSHASETTAVAQSTAKLLKMSTTDAAQFKKGDAVLIKDSAKGYQIRPVSSVSGTDVTLGFELPAAPTASSKVSGFVTYFPLNENLPVYDLWHYIGGGEAGNESVQDCRTTSMTVSATAQDLINATFSVEGTAYQFNETFADEYQVVAGSADFDIVWSNTGTRTNTAVSIAAGRYTGAEMATALQTAFRSVDSGFGDATVVFADNRFTFADSNTRFYLNFEGYPAMAATLGFAEADTSSSSLVNTLKSTKDAQTVRFYDSGIASSAIEYDTTDPIVARDQQLFIGDADDNICVDASSLTFTFGTPKSLITSICTESGNYRSVINQRTAVLAVSAILQEDERRFFSEFKSGDTVHFAFVGGKKSGDNWKAGECFSIYGSPASITAFAMTDTDGVFSLEMELTCFADGEGEGSIFISFC